MSFIDTIFTFFAQDPERPLVVEMHGSEARPCSRGQVAGWVAHARGVLLEAGVVPGERVVLIAPNSAKWVAADLAALAAGAVVVPMYARQDPGELVAMIADCEPSLVVVADDALGSRLTQAGAGVEQRTFADLFDSERAPCVQAPLAREPDEAVTIIYTSGTSGVPKGVVLSCGNVDHMLPVTRDALIAMMGPREQVDRVFHYLPFCFAGSRVVLWTCLFRGNPIHVSTNIDNLGAELAAAAPNYVLNVPMLLERIKNKVEEGVLSRGAAISGLYRRARDAWMRTARGEARVGDGLLVALGSVVLFGSIKKKIGPNLDCLICGSAPLGEATQRWFEMLGIPVYQVYGLTETTAIVTMDVPPEVFPGRVGRAISGVEMKISDEGELLVQGPNVFQGYWKRPDATDAAFLDGWFRTGDQVDLHEGSLRIVGRVKNILVPTSGHNIAPEPIERQIVETIEGVEQAVLVGHGRASVGALVTGAFTDEGLQQGIDRINEGLPHYRRVRAWRRASEPFTIENGLLTANRKLRRTVIEAHFVETIEEMYQ
jgi:long-chain acyl-CoA synthetase